MDKLLSSLPPELSPFGLACCASALLSAATSEPSSQLVHTCSEAPLSASQHVSDLEASLPLRAGRNSENQTQSLLDESSMYGEQQMDKSEEV